MMEEDIQRSDEDDLPQPKLGGVCNNDYLMQFDNSSSIFGALEPHRSNEMFLPQHHNLYPLAPDFNYMNDQAAVEDLVSAAILTAGKNALWQPVDVPSSLPDDCLTSLASNTYDTRDYDPTDQSVLEPSAVGVYDNNHTKTYASDLGDPYEAANPHTRYDFEDSSAPLAVGQADVLAEIQSATIIHKRKRPVEGLIDRKEALDVCVESMQDAIENMAQRFGVDFDAVMDLCLQQRAKRKSTSLHISDKANTTDPTSLSTESADSIVPSREDPAPVKGVDASSIITEPSKGPRSNPGASHATKQESGNNRVHCPRCGTGISRRTDLPRHLRTHDPGEFQCQYPKCKMAFSRKDKFCDHLRKIHGDVNSRIDTVGRRKEDPGDDPDSGSSRRGGMYQVNKPFQGRQQQTSSTRLGHSACDGSSNGGTSQSHGNHEHFFPLLSNILATEFMRNYHSAQVIRKLGQGGFGHVYEFSMATGADGNRQAFACKMIRLPDHGQRAVIERARNEIGVLQVLDHPHIVTFAGAFISDKEIMISTRPVADCNLKAFLNRQLSPLSSVAKCQLWQAVGGLASAIDYIHSHGMGGGLHGDIKPENILVIQDTGVKSWTRLLLADFGSARLPSLSSASPVNHGNQAVTPRYCAPEWFTNNNERGPASDIWSFGCILTQIVTYLHDKTMADFDTYRTRDKDSKDDWTYCESLPIVNDWLSKLSKNWMESTGHIGRSEHMDLISDMLSPNPKYRPAAKEVVARLEALRQLFPEKTNRDWNYGEQLTQPHYYSHLDAIGDAKGAFKSQTIEALSKCGDSNTSLRSTNTELDESTLIKYPTHSPAQASGKKHGLVYTSMTYLTALTVSNWTWDAPRVYGLEKGIEGSINPLADYGLAMERAGEDVSQHNGASTHFHQNESLTSPSNDLAIKSINNQTTSDIFDFQQLWQSHYQLKPVPNSQESQFQGVKLYSELRAIKPKPDSSPQNLEQRSRYRRVGRWETSKVRSASRKMRQFRCCNCQMKDPWSCGPPCNQCREFVPTPFRTMMRYRGALVDYTAYFFPELVYSRLSESAIADVVRKNVIGFTTNVIAVEMSSGPEYAKLELFAIEFVPSNRDFLCVSYVEQASTNQSYSFASSYAPPLGVSATEIDRLRLLCLNHISSVDKQGRSCGELEWGHTSKISWKVLKAINQYRELSSGTSGQTALLQKAGMLYAMHYFMGRLITFTKTSAVDAVTNLRSPALLPYIPTLTSTLLNLQIKKAMNSLLFEFTRDVLDGLGHLFAACRKQPFWAEAFCVVLILCMCMEELQMSIDSYVMAALRKDPSRALHSASILRGLDDRVFRHITELFHMAYKTARSSLSRTKRLGFNPIRDGFPLNESKGVTPQMTILVQDVRQIIKQCGKDTL